MIDRNSAVCAAVGEALAKAEVDLSGVVSMADILGTKLEKDTRQLLPEANTIIVLGAEIYPEFLRHSRPQKVTGAISLNDLLDRHFDYLNSRLNKAVYDVARAARHNGLKALPLTVSARDSRFLYAALSFKHAAQAAGLGYIGRSSLLITPDYGPRVRLAVCLTEAILEPSQTEKTDNVCEDCNVCIQGCPSHALSQPPADEPYAINKFACSVYRNASGTCAECMRLCPAGRSK